MVDLSILPPRLAAKIEADTATGCWEWRAHRNRAGYGQAYHAGRVNHAHRIIFQLLRGDLPHGLQCDHLCRNRGCVNPDHLEAVTPRENTRRGDSNKRYRGRSACDKGHTYTTASLRIDPNGRRVCRVCVAANTRRYKAKLRRGQ